MIPIPQPPIPESFVSGQFLATADLVELLLHATDHGIVAMTPHGWGVVRRHLADNQWPDLRPDLDGARVLLLDRVTVAAGLPYPSIADLAAALTPEHITGEDNPT